VAWLRGPMRDDGDHSQAGYAARGQGTDRTAVEALIGNEPKTTVQVITLVTQKDMLGSLLYPDFHAALQEITKAKPLTPAGLGYWLRSVKDDRFSLLEITLMKRPDLLRPHWFKSYERAAESNFWELTWT